MASSPARAICRVGVGGEELHQWLYRLAAFRGGHGEEGGEVNASTPFAEDILGGAGARRIMGRNMFGGGRDRGTSRGRAGGETIHPSTLPALGAVMRSLAVGRVEESRSSDFHLGEYLTGMFGWNYAVVDAEAIEPGSGLPISILLGVLGLNGLTAHVALLEIGQPKAVQPRSCSTGAGAVGSDASVKSPRSRGAEQSALLVGPDKVRVCGVANDSAVDYRAADFESALDAACPEGASMLTSITRQALSAIPSC